MKVTMNDDYLEIQIKEEEPILCIDPKVAGVLLYELFYNGVDSMEKWYNYLMELLEEEDD